MGGTRTKDSQSHLPDQETVINMEVIQCYALANDRDEEGKEEFSADFLLSFKTVPRRNITIMMGGFNAKIGSDNRGYEQIM